MVRSPAALTATCLINNYNYAQFVCAAVESALEQTVPFDQIVVVDDGSTDDSVARLTQKWAQCPRVEIVAKENAGQLSCFNAGLARARGELVFLLDADDQYEANYLAHALGIYERDKACDFVSCGHREFGHADRVRLKYPADRDLGYSVVLAAYLREWIGAKTSCLSMRRSVLEKILPLPFVEDWRTRADDCLIFGASLAGARKYYLARPLVRYRVHDSNHFRGRAPDQHALYRRRLAINRLFEHLERKFSYNVARLGDFHHREFHTIEKPTLREFRQYLLINGQSRLSFLRRLGCMAEMARHFVKANLARGQQSEDATSDEHAPVLLKMPQPGTATEQASASRGARPAA